MTSSPEGHVTEACWSALSFVVSGIRRMLHPWAEIPPRQFLQGDSPRFYSVKSSVVYRIAAAIVFAATACFGFSFTLIASDQASDLVYGDGWQNGDNGGFGFQGWLFNGVSPYSQFMGTSTANGASPPSGGIDTAGQSWGMSANGGGTSIAIRPWSSTYSVDLVSFNMDNGPVDAGSASGWDNLDAGMVITQSESFMVVYRAGKANYEFAYQLLNQPVVYTDSGVGYTEAGVHVDFYKNGANAILCNLTRLDNAQNNFYNFATFFPSNMIAAAFRNNNAGAGPNNDFYANSLELYGTVPEPASLTVLGLGALLLRRRRR